VALSNCVFFEAGERGCDSESRAILLSGNETTSPLSAQLAAAVRLDVLERPS
jgi:hypothetical protein